MNSNWKIEFFGGEGPGVNRLSWSGVIAGISTFIAVFLALSLIGFSIGLTTFNPLHTNVFSHMKTNLTIWTVIALILSFGAGGFISGLVANRAGFLQGFMTWVMGVIIIAFLVSNTVGGLVRTTGTVVSDLSSSSSKGVSILVSKSGEKLEKEFHNLAGDIAKVDTSKLEADLDQALKDTDIKELQPEYLNQQLEDSKKDIEDSAKNILLNPIDYKGQVDQLINDLETRAHTITSSVNKDSIAKAVNKNTDLSPEEANLAVDNIYREYEEASVKTAQSIEEARDKIENLGQSVEVVKEEVKEEVNKVTDKGARETIYLFIGLIIALFVAGFAGKKGSSFLA